MTRAAPRVFAVSGGAVVVSALALGLATIGTPGNARKLRLDQMRVTDLISLSNQVNGYVRSHGTLPATLADAAVNSLDMRDHDPQTGASYEFIVKGDKSYDLCATFALPSSVADDLPPAAVTNLGLVGAARGAAPGRWDHPAGRHCFAFGPATNP